MTCLPIRCILGAGFGGGGGGGRGAGGWVTFGGAIFSTAAGGLMFPNRLTTRWKSLPARTWQKGIRFGWPARFASSNCCSCRDIAGPRIWRTRWLPLPSGRSGWWPWSWRKSSACPANLNRATATPGRARAGCIRRGRRWRARDCPGRCADGSGFRRRSDCWRSTLICRAISSRLPFLADVGVVQAGPEMAALHVLGFPPVEQDGKLCCDASIGQ